MAKKHKTSELSGLELQLAYQSLKTLQSSIVFEEEPSADEDSQTSQKWWQIYSRACLVPRYVNNLQMVIALTIVQDLSFSGLINAHLSKLNIFLAGSLGTACSRNKQKRPKL
jgi:hypothetical protein